MNTVRARRSPAGLLEIDPAWRIYFPNLAGGGRITPESANDWLSQLDDQALRSAIRIALQVRCHEVLHLFGDSDFVAALFSLLFHVKSVESRQVVAEELIAFTHEHARHVELSPLRSSYDRWLFFEPPGLCTEDIMFRPDHIRQHFLRVAFSLSEVVPSPWVMHIIEFNLRKSHSWFDVNIASLIPDSIYGVLHESFTKRTLGAGLSFESHAGLIVVMKTCTSLLLQPDAARQLIQHGVVAEMLRFIAMNIPFLTTEGHLKDQLLERALCSIGRLEIPEFNESLQNVLLDVVLNLLPMKKFQGLRFLQFAIGLNTSIQASIKSHRFELDPDIRRFSRLNAFITTENSDQAGAVQKLRSKQSDEFARLVRKILKTKDNPASENLSNRTRRLFEMMLTLLSRNDCDWLRGDLVFLPDSALKSLARVKTPDQQWTLVHVLARKGAKLVWFGLSRKFLSASLNVPDVNGIAPVHMTPSREAASETAIWEALVFTDGVDLRPPQDGGKSDFYCRIWKRLRYCSSLHHMSWKYCKREMYARLCSQGAFRKLRHFGIMYAHLCVATHQSNSPAGQRSQDGIVNDELDAARMVWSSGVSLLGDLIKVYNRDFLEEARAFARQLRAYHSGHSFMFFECLMRANFMLAIRASAWKARLRQKQDQVSFQLGMLPSDLLRKIFAGEYLKWFKLESESAGLRLNYRMTSTSAFS